MSLRALLADLPIPILQAPMVGASDERLAIAVSNAGGLGSLAAGALAPQDIAVAVAAIRAATDRPFGVNLLMAPAAAPAAEAVEAALERIHLGLGYEYDPEVVEALIRTIGLPGRD